MRIRFSAVAFIVALLSGPALSDPLPDTAQPMASFALSALYAGRTVDWGDTKMYFRPDGTVKGVYPHNGIMWGKWQVRDNEICVGDLQGADDRSVKQWQGDGDCWKWWIDSDKLPVTPWTLHVDSKTPDQPDGYYRDAVKDMTKGDGVSEQFDPLFAELQEQS